MSIIIDAVTVLIILVSTYAGYKKGIAEVGVKLFAIVFSLIVSLVFYSPITHFVVDNTNIDETIEAFIIEKGIVKTETNTEQSSNIDAYIEKYAKDIAKETQNNVVETVARPIALKVVGIGTLIALFLTTRIAVTILQLLTNFITKLPIIKQCNEYAGLLYGVLRGLIIVGAILAIIIFGTTFIGTTEVNTAIEESYVTKFFYEFLLKYI